METGSTVSYYIYYLALAMDILLVSCSWEDELTWISILLVYTCLDLSYMIH